MSHSIINDEIEHIRKISITKIFNSIDKKHQIEINLLEAKKGRERERKEKTILRIEYTVFLCLLTRTRGASLDFCFLKKQ